MNWLSLDRFDIFRRQKQICLEDVPPDNGYVFCGTYLPEEVLILILSYVDKQTLAKKCRYVCKLWNLLIRKNVWKVKAEREHKNMFLELKLHQRLPWGIYYSIVLNNPFGRNLLKNDSGQNGLENWDITINGGNMWKVESPPIGVPENEYASRFTSCFATSFHDCMKQQCIVLKDEGLTPDLMDKYQPDIFISEWYTSRWDCGSYYRLEVQLLDEKKKIVKFKRRNPYEFHVNMTGILGGWKEVNYTFKSYGPGVRYIMFIHCGKDTQYWAGHYGSKMTAARVEIPAYVLNKLQIQKSNILDQ